MERIEGKEFERTTKDYWLAGDMLFVTGGLAYKTASDGKTVIWGTEEEARAKYPASDISRKSRK